MPNGDPYAYAEARTLRRNGRIKYLNTLSVYIIGAFIVWAAILAIGDVVHGPTLGYPILHVFGGFNSGMLAMDIAMRVHSKCAQTLLGRLRWQPLSYPTPGSGTALL